MKKITTSITLDFDVWSNATENIKNLSGFVNSILKESVKEDNPDNKKAFDLLEFAKKKEKKALELEKEIEEKRKVLAKLNGDVKDKQTEWDPFNMPRAE